MMRLGGESTDGTWEQVMRHSLVFRLSLGALTIAFVALWPRTVVVAAGEKSTPEPRRTSETVASGLYFPSMNPARGRTLFAGKGCVVCHSVNGIGGAAGPPLDAPAGRQLVNPFSFSARMWRGAEMMIAVQQDVFAEQIYLTGQELFDIIGFAYSRAEQRRFGESDVPHDVLELIEHRHEGHAGHGHPDPHK